MPKKKSTKQEERAFYLLLIFFLGPALMGYSIFSLNYAGVLLGLALEAWGIRETPEIHPYLKLIINWKGRKQVVKVKGSPGAQTVAAQAEIINLQVGDRVQVSRELAIRVYTPLRREVMTWDNPIWANFAEWERLDRDDPYWASLAKKTAPDIADLCDQALGLFREIRPLRATLNNMITEETNKIAQEFEPHFDKGSRVTFANIRLIVDNGQDIPFFLPHMWVLEQNSKEYAQTLHRENFPNSKSWRLEVLTIGQNAGNNAIRTVATNEEAEKFGDRIIEFLDTQEKARQLRDNLEKVRKLKDKLLPRINEEISKG